MADRSAREPPNWQDEFAGGHDHHERVARVMYQTLGKAAGSIRTEFGKMMGRSHVLFTFIVKREWPPGYLGLRIKTLTKRVDKFYATLFLIKSRKIRLRRDWTMDGMNKLIYRQ